MLALIHPVVRVVSFIFFSLFIALGNISQLVVAAVILLLLFFYGGFPSVVRIWPMFRRMRWFFLSIFMIYLFLTPGQPLWLGGGNWWIPTLDGVLMGGHRLLVLGLMLLAVHWLLWATSRTELVSALYWMAMPLTMFGFSRVRFAIRVSLVLANIDRVQECVNEQIKHSMLARGDLNGYASVAAALVSDVVHLSDKDICHPIEIDIDNAPALWQWTWLLGLVMIMLLAA